MRNKGQEQKNKLYAEIIKKVRNAVKGYKLNDIRLALNRFYRTETDRRRLMLEIKEKQDALKSL